MKHANPDAIGVTVSEILEYQDLLVEEVVLLVKSSRETKMYNLYGGR